jgi:Tol biopolymer transport system component
VQVFVKSVRQSMAVVIAAVLFLGSSTVVAQSATNQLGIFESQSDVGSVTPPGTLAYDTAKGVYTISAAGANLWSTEDAFHFVWKKVSGDVSLTAEMNFPDSSGNPNPHRKTVLIFRQTLDADSAYADAAQHGSGMTALQYRETKGATTQDIELNIDAPRRVRLEKRGDAITMFLSMGTEPLHQVGATIRLHFSEPFYAGIGVCSHNKDVVEKATFANVELKSLTAPAVPAQKALYSTLQTVGIEDNFRRQLVILSERGRIEAPNWSRDGKTLIFNRDGHIWTIPAEGGKAAMLETGAATNCTGSHGLSPDGKLLAISCSTPGKKETRVYIVPSGGGEPRLLTETPWSYFHSWSPDGKTIAFTRPDFKGGGNILSIPVAGGAETALTTGGGISDDPDYSPDGKYIYFNSDRAGGSMQIWRMRPDGSAPEQVTSDEFNNWTPHPSPDGKSILILSYDKGVTGHPAGKDIAFRILNVADGKIRLLVKVIGGSGSDNVPNWAPDGNHFAFVSTQMLPAEETGSTE